MTVSREGIEAAIGTFTEPHYGTDLISAKCVKQIDVDSGAVAVKIVLGYPGLAVIGTVAAAKYYRGGVSIGFG